jgi:hypothetical protein
MVLTRRWKQAITHKKSKMTKLITKFGHLHETKDLAGKAIRLLAVNHPVTILNRPKKYLVGFALQSMLRAPIVSRCLSGSR